MAGLLSSIEAKVNELENQILRLASYVASFGSTSPTGTTIGMPGVSLTLVGSSLTAVIAGTTMISLAGMASDFIEVGPNPAQTMGYIRVPFNGNAIASRNRNNTGDIGLIGLDDTQPTLNNIIIGGTATAPDNIEIGCVTMKFAVGNNDCQLGQFNLTSDTQPTRTMNIQAQSAWTGAAVNINGGNLRLQTGSAQANGTNGTRGWCRVNLGQTSTMTLIEATEIAVGPTQRVVALAQCGSGITTTNVPTGDGVIFIGAAQTNPSSAPVGGCILYAPHGTGTLAYRTGGNFQLTLPTGTSATATAGGGQAVPGTVLNYLVFTFNDGTTGKIAVFSA